MTRGDPNPVAPSLKRPAMLVSSTPQADTSEKVVRQTGSLDTQAAVRLISETAHDLRSPLTAVQESIRLVCDGDLGPVNDSQQSCLTSAVDQCGCIEQMVGEMVQLERLRTGTPRVHRQWVAASDIRRAVDDSLRPWAVPRGIDILWDGADDPSMLVFADPAKLRRLVVNLATNAIRASAEGGFVLIRLARIRHGETIRWSVVDRGRGISETELVHVADRDVSFAGGEGLGLAISRQLAALHFSSLKIRSRMGKGTEVSFETAASSPRSVAGTWTRWRIGFIGSVCQSTTCQEGSIELFDQSGERHIRLDPPVVTVSLSHEASRPGNEDRFAAGVVSLGGTVSRSASDQFDIDFQSQLQMFDLACRVDTRRWVWCLDADELSARKRVEAIADALTTRIPGIRMNWSEPKSVSLDPHRTVWQLSDLLVRQTLSTPSAMHGCEMDDAQQGSTAIAPSAIASARLDAELCRLTADLRSQTSRLQSQAKNLRPTI